MADLISLFNRQKRRVDKTVDLTFWRMMLSEDPINQLLPLKNYPMRELLMFKFSHSKPTIARIIAEDQEIPLSRSKMALTEELLSQCKMGKAFGFTDKHYELMRKMEGYIALNNIDLVTEVEKYFFGMLEDIPYAIGARLTQMSMQILTRGNCTFTDPITRARFALDYIGTAGSPTNGLSTAQYNSLLPAIPAIPWSTTATATALQDLRTHAQAYYDIFGKYPDNAIFRQMNIRQIANMPSTKQYMVVKQGGTNASAGDLAAYFIEDADVLKIISQVTNIPNVFMFDATYSDEDSFGNVSSDGNIGNVSGSGVVTGAGQDRYYLDDNYYAFVDNDIFERALVPTVEKDFLPGIYARADRLLDIPRRDQLAGVANGVPALFDSRKVAARKVA